MKKKALKIKLPVEEKENLKAKLREEFGEELDDAELGLLMAIRRFKERELNGESNIFINLKGARIEEAPVKEAQIIGANDGSIEVQED